MPKSIIIIISASLSISIASEALMLRNIHLDHLSVFRSVSLSVRKVYCGWWLMYNLTLSAKR